MSFSNGFAVGAQVRQNRDAARERATNRNQELTKQGYSFDDNGNMSVRDNSAAQAEQLQAQETAQLAKALQGKLAAQQTDKSLEDFSHTGDANYLQSALDQDPVLKNAWLKRGVQMVSNIDFEGDSNLLRTAGFNPAAYDTDEKREVLKKSMYKVYDGTNWQVGLADQMAAETGAFKRMGNRRAEPIVENRKKMVDLLAGPKSSPNTVEGHKYEKQINAAAEKYDLPANLIASMMKQESANKSDAVSHKGASGLMQLMPATAEELGVTDIFDVDQNVMAGAKYMKQQLDKYGGDVRMALAAYNAGPGNVDKYGGIPPFGETQNYVKKIMANFEEGEQYYGRTIDEVTNSMSFAYQEKSKSPEDQTIDTILNHRRGIANASQGKTNQQIDQETSNDTQRVVNDTRGVEQRDTELAIKDESNRIEILKNNTKLMTDGVTTKQKDLNAASKRMDNLMNNYGGEEGFYNADFSDPKEYRKAIVDVQAIEKLEGTELSEADKKSITEVRQLISLGGPGSKLSASQTGLIDSTLKGVEKYISDNVEGIEAKSAYMAFRNTVRNALFGSALTEAEIKSFNEAYGTLGNKLGPVLQMFETNLMQVQAKLDSTANLMNPLSAKVRLGADQEKLLAIRDALQVRIDHFKGLDDSSDRMTPEEKTDKLNSRFGSAK